MEDDLPPEQSIRGTVDEKINPSNEIHDDTPSQPLIDKNFYGDSKTLSPPPEAPAQQAPMSPGKKLLYFAGSPGRFIKKQVAPGSVKSSMFSLVIICLGAGQITIPYTFYKLGFLGGCLAIAFGGGISIFASWMLAHACQMTNAASYEEVAMVSFGKGWQRGTSFSMVCANAGFLISYIVLVSKIFLTNRWL